MEKIGVMTHFMGMMIQLILMIGMGAAFIAVISLALSSTSAVTKRKNSLFDL